MSNKLGHKTWTKDKFITEAKNKYGNNFDYSYVTDFANYKRDKVKIKCNVCGNIFETTPAMHLKSGMGGCKVCSKKEKYTTEKFISIASSIHNNKYDYSLVNIENCYKTKNEFVEIICPVHGVFKQKWKLHLAGQGCKQCFLESQFSTLEEFVEKAKRVHGDKYDYSKSIYRGRNYKINIICPIHGEFTTTPARHLHGQQCNKCAHNFNFYKHEKLNILTEYDLLSMDWAVILDLIGEDKLPNEFKCLCKFGENTPERKKMIDDLKETYNIETTDEEEISEVENNIDDSIETEVNDINSEENIYNETDEDTELDPLKEIKDIGSLLNKDNEDIFSTGDKFVHIIHKQMNRIWNLVLRDNENHSTKNIEIIKSKLNDNITKFERYVYEEFLKEYEEVINLEIH